MLGIELCTYSAKFLPYIRVTLTTDERNGNKDKFPRNTENRTRRVKTNVGLALRMFSYVEVKCCLFRTFSYSLYISSLCLRSRVRDLMRLEVCYNTVFKILVGLNEGKAPDQYLCIRMC